MRNLSGCIYCMYICMFVYTNCQLTSGCNSDRGRLNSMSKACARQNSPMRSCRQRYSSSVMGGGVSSTINSVRFWIAWSAAFLSRDGEVVFFLDDEEEEVFLWVLVGVVVFDFFFLLLEEDEDLFALDRGEEGATAVVCRSLEEASLFFSCSISS